MRLVFWAVVIAVVGIIMMPALMDTVLQNFEPYVDQYRLEVQREVADTAVLLFAFLNIILVGIAFTLSFLFSHRIIGPLVNLRNALREATEGHWRRELKFRNKDLFQELAQLYNQLSEKYSNDRSAGVVQTVSGVIARLENLKANVPEEAREELEFAVNELKRLRSPEA